MTRLDLKVRLERWPLRAPFRTAKRTVTTLEVVVVELEAAGATGWGEAAGVHYLHDTPQKMLAQIAAVQKEIEAGVSRRDLRALLPPGGARNALDCALWDLEATLSGVPAWRTAGLDALNPITTVFGIGADDPVRMADTARAYGEAGDIKIKLTGDALDGERVRAVRDACPGVWLSVDANRGCDRAAFDALLPVLVDAKVACIEQPFPVGAEPLLAELGSPIPIFADEPVQTSEDIPPLLGRFDGVNIKLDKAGGLSEALSMVACAKQAGLRLMVGNMFGTSLAMAPAFIIGQFCEIADLDGPIFLERDRLDACRYRGGQIDCTDMAWGGA